MTVDGNGKMTLLRGIESECDFVGPVGHVELITLGCDPGRLVKRIFVRSKDPVMSAPRVTANVAPRAAFYENVRDVILGQAELEVRPEDAARTIEIIERLKE